MTLARRWAPYAWAILLFLIACWRIIRFEVVPHHGGLGAASHLQIFKAYNYTILLSNYFTEGFVRRGLQGSIFYLFHGFSYEPRLVAFHLFCAAWLCIPLVIILRRLARTPGRGWIWLSLVLALSPQLFMAWARDVARADMLVAGFSAWALVACLNRRYLVAALIVFVSSQAHETGLVYGGSLCAAMALLDYRAGRLKFGKAAAALGLLGGLWLLAGTAQHAFGPTSTAIARDILAHAMPRGAPVYIDPANSLDIAVYFAVGGARTLRSSACEMFASPAAYLYIASIFFVLALHGVVLPARSRLRLGLLLLVGALPMTVLSILAVDYGRWLSFAVLNWWLINATLQLKGVDELTIELWPPPASTIAGIMLLAMGPGDYPGANTAVSKIAARLWKDAPMVERQDRCDPTWRSVVTSASSP